LVLRPPPNPSLGPNLGLERAKEIGKLAGFVETVKPILPIAALLVILPILWWMFRATWRALDQDAHE